MTVHDTPGEFLDGYVQILAEASATGRRLTRDELRSRRELGARAAASGYGWRVLVREHLAAIRTGWPTAAAPDSVLSVIEQAVDAFADGYEGAQRLLPYADRPIARVSVQGELSYISQQAVQERIAPYVSASFFTIDLAGMRAETFPFGSPELVELEAYLMWRARGMKMESPAVRP